MDVKENILRFIEEKRETSFVDFKRECYGKLSQSDFPKDICAFANLISDEEKYIIFGVEDKTRQIVGINEADFYTQDDIDDYISKTIEPFVDVVCGTFATDEGVVIGYIKVLSSNRNPPYVIKEVCGKNNKFSKGDIFVRKGTCNQRASRSDIDSMYLKNGEVKDRFHDNIAVVKPIHIDNAGFDPTYGHIDIEIFNNTTRPLLIDGGKISIIADAGMVNRQIVSILPYSMISERPLELAAQSRKVYTILFDFFSQDCVDFGFDTDGKIDGTVEMVVVLYDTDDNMYFSNRKECLLIAKGNILHKVKLKYYQENMQYMSLWERLKFKIKK